MHHYRSPICSQDETELALNTNQMQIDDTLDDKNLDINEFTEPSLMFKAENEFKVPEKSKKENFLKGCKWLIKVSAALIVYIFFLLILGRQMVLVSW